jgi:hypothetical protein
MPRILEHGKNLHIIPLGAIGTIYSSQSDQIIVAAKYKTQHNNWYLGCLWTKEGLQTENHPVEEQVLCIAWSVMLLITVLCVNTCALSAHTRVRVSISASPASATTTHLRVSISASVTTSHLWLAATPLSLPEAGTVYSDISGLIVLQVIWLLGEQD